MTQERLIEGCINRDREAGAELFRIYAPKMMGICSRLVKDATVAEDLVHDGFVVVFTRIGDYRGEGSFEGWMRRIFVNVSLNYLKNCNRLEMIDKMDDNNQSVCLVEPEAFRNIELKELMGTINRLPDGLRTELLLYSVEGYTHEEISGMLGISVRSSESRLYRAKKMLIKILTYEGRIG